MKTKFTEYFLIVFGIALIGSSLTLVTANEIGLIGAGILTLSVIIFESVCSTLDVVREKDIDLSRLGCLLHLVAAISFFILIHFDHPILEDFEYEYELGHGEFASGYNSAATWWLLIIPVTLRLLLVQPILAIMAKVRK